MASVCIGMTCASALIRLAGNLGGIERGPEPLVVAVVASALPEFRPTDSRRAMPADQLAVRVFRQDGVDENVMRNDDVAFHAHHLGFVGDAARAVAQIYTFYHDVALRA